MKLKKILPLLLSICMVGSTFVGCTDSSSDNGSDADSNVTDTDGSGSSSGGSSTDSGSSGSGNESSDSSSGSGTGTDTSTDTGKDTGTDTSTETGTGTGTETDTDTGAGTDTDTDETDTTNGGTNTTTVYMVGDSTMCSFEDSYYLPRYGYGTQLENYLNDNATVVNLAMSGRSSLSFLSETNYTTLTSSIGEGDYLIIGFGHNDEKSGETFTSPKLDYQTEKDSDGNYSFQYILYNYYVKVAEDAGATAILCTPIVRYNASANYTGSSGHVTDDGDYPEAIRTLGTATGTTVIDLTAITAADYVAKGTAAMNYHAFTKTKDGVRVDDSIDTTHLNMYGAKMVAYELVTELQKTTNQLKHYVLSDITEPTYNSDLTVASDYSAAINADYTEIDYTAFDASNYTSNKLTDDGWYSTVMGDASSVSAFTVSESNGTFTVGNTDGKGKFASAGDGFAAAFMQISVEKNFTATVTMTVTSMNSSISTLTQAAFGMMLRDDIYVDTIEKGITSTFAAAGFIGAEKSMSSTSLSMYAGFSRESGKLKQNSDTLSVTAGNTYTLTLKRENQTVYITINDGTKDYTASYPDIDLYEIDSEYMYLCLFANRGMSVEFSNFSMTDDGTAQGA